MIFKTLKNFTRRLIAGANIATIILMAAVGYSGRLSPLEHATLSQAHFVFPALLLVNLAFLAFWTLFKPRYVLLPLAGLLLCYTPVRKYAPLNLPAKAPEGALKVLTYNVAGFQHKPADTDEERAELANYIVAQQADLVCLQEAAIENSRKSIVEKILNDAYAYHDTICCPTRGNPLALYSHYPIVKKENITFPDPTSGNHSGVFYVDIDGDTVLVINNHLQSLQLSHADREGFQSIVERSIDRDSARAESHKLLDKIKAASLRRAPQAEAVADYISRHAQESIIVCGDFNDTPLSYTNHIIGRLLTNCYEAAGLGPGFTYHENGMLVRIDNILCSKDWTPYECKTDRKIDASDHNPVVCKLKKGPKP